jgi:polyribonucleotide nucleotidyltransferase
VLHKFICDLEGRTLTIETGELAQQANAAVTVRMGDTMVLVTAVMSPNAREGIDFFPLTVDFEERLYAAGRIPGSFFRREGRPGQEAILSGRLTDRTIRPLFPKGLRNEVQVIATVLSTDQQNQPDILAMIGANAALAISDVPFDGPASGTRVAHLNGNLVPFPTFADTAAADLDIVVAGTRDAVVMLEAGAKEVSEDLISRAVDLGQRYNAKVIDTIERMVREIGRAKVVLPDAPAPDSALDERLHAIAGARLERIVFSGEEKGEKGGTDELLERALTELGEEFPKDRVVEALERLTKKLMRSGILEQGRRPDGRRITEIRPLQARVSLLPRTHGSGLFQRGQTQILTIATLGSLGEQQKLDTLTPEETRRFIHHYNFPPFSVGEVRRVGSPGRREVGHGALAERALEPVIPSEQDFPYTIRLVSEALGSNGSTSMGSVCGSTLALMDAGVPIKAPVAGVAMGLITSDDMRRFTVLTDIQGLEDHLGDMDFKVAGTANGVTAIQLDIKLKGLPRGALEETLSRAREARLTILRTLQAAIPQHRETLSPYAPRVLRLSIPVDKIGALIGPGGKTIRGIIDATKATVDVEDDGTVLVGSPNADSLERARQMIEALTREVQLGDVFTGKVVRIVNFGAFVNIAPGKDALVRIGELSDQRVDTVEDVVKIGQEITVKVVEIDAMGRINASRRALLVPEEEYTPTGRGPSGPPGGERRGGFGGRPGGGFRPGGRGPGGPPRFGDRGRGGDF